MVAKDEILFVKNIDGFDGPLACEDVAIRNLVVCSKITYCVTMQVKITLWKPDNQASIF